MLDALEACAGFDRTPVTIFSDGPRDAAAEPAVSAVRAAVRARMRPNMTLVERPANLGLANSIIAGTSELCARHGRAIVIEDDHVLAPLALAWFNSGLDRYADAADVMQIAGFMFDVPRIAAAGRGVFLYHTTSWGWATWQRAWAQFDPDCPGWEATLADPAARRHFDLGGAIPYAAMMRRQMAGESDSWAVRWYWTVVARRGLVLHPPQSFVRNIGLAAGEATHGQRSAGLIPVGPTWSGSDLPPLPERPELDRWAVSAYIRRLRWSPYGLVNQLARLRAGLRRGAG